MKTIINTAELQNIRVIKLLTYLMFMMFAMTTDAVGLIIPEVVKQFNLSLTAAGSFQYASMIAIALGGLFLGFVADRLGRKKQSLLVCAFLQLIPIYIL